MEHNIPEKLNISTAKLQKPENSQALFWCRLPEGMCWDESGCYHGNSNEFPDFFFFVHLVQSKRKLYHNYITELRLYWKLTYPNTMWKVDKCLICCIFEGYVCWSKETCQSRSLVIVLTRLYTTREVEFLSRWVGISFWMLYSDQLSDPPSFLACRWSLGLHTVPVGAKV
jgi:hypothetical protein